MILRLFAESARSCRPGAPLVSILLCITEQGPGPKAGVCTSVVEYTLQVTCLSYVSLQLAGNL